MKVTQRKGEKCAVLTGEFRHTLDAKGRTFVPAKFRADLGQSVIVAKTFGDYLAMYSEEEWKVFDEGLDKLLVDTEDDAIVKLVHFIRRNAMPTEVDNQGRILIGNAHREAAKLEKEVAFIGMRKYVEIWNTEEIDKEMDTYDLGELKSLAKKLRIGFA